MSDAASDGFLRWVMAINTSGGQAVVQTQAATLEDAIQQGEVYVNQRLSPQPTPKPSRSRRCHADAIFGRFT